MSVCDPIASRHSVRRFSPEPIGRSIIDTIVDAGLLSPSSKNRQPWEMVILDSREDIISLSSTLSKIVEELEASGTPLDTTSASVRIMSEAPCIVFVGYRDPYTDGIQGDLTDREFVDALSLGACIENMCIQATS